MNNVVVIDGVKTVDLAKLIELKLASGMTGLARLKDLADVQELIRVKGLDEGIADRLDPFVRDKYLELCRDVVQAHAQDSENRSVRKGPAHLRRAFLVLRPRPSPAWANSRGGRG